MSQYKPMNCKNNQTRCFYMSRLLFLFCSCKGIIVPLITWSWFKFLYGDLETMINQKLFQMCWLKARFLNFWLIFFVHSIFIASKITYDNVDGTLRETFNKDVMKQLYVWLLLGFWLLHIMMACNKSTKS